MALSLSLADFVACISVIQNTKLCPLFGIIWKFTEWRKKDKYDFLMGELFGSHLKLQEVILWINISIFWQAELSNSECLKINVLLVILSA